MKNRKEFRTLRAAVEQLVYEDGHTNLARKVRKMASPTQIKNLLSERIYSKYMSRFVVNTLKNEIYI
jgi:hypothetical protein